jgi:hypothetical protein
MGRRRSIDELVEIQIQELEMSGKPFIKPIAKPSNRAPSPPALFAGGEGGEAG